MHTYSRYSCPSKKIMYAKFSANMVTLSFANLGACGLKMTANDVTEEDLASVLSSTCKEIEREGETNLILTTLMTHDICLVVSKPGPPTEKLRSSFQTFPPCWRPLVLMFHLSSGYVNMPCMGETQQSPSRPISFSMATSFPY